MTLPSFEPYVNIFKKHIRNCVNKQKALDEKDRAAKSSNIDF